MRPMINIAGVDIPDPSTYTGTTSTIVDSGRNVEGVVVGAVIRDDVGKVTAKWNFITADAWANILRLFSTKRGGAFVNTVTFYCQDTNDWETRQMYVNDRSAEVFLRDNAGNIRGYVNASLALIEV